MCIRDRSHIIKGRIPEAIHKPANQLLESDKTIYYERAAFSIDVPTIYETVGGNNLNLSDVYKRQFHEFVAEYLIRQQRMLFSGKQRHRIGSKFAAYHSFRCV